MDRQRHFLNAALWHLGLVGVLIALLIVLNSCGTASSDYAAPAPAPEPETELEGFWFFTNQMPPFEIRCDGLRVCLDVFEQVGFWIEDGSRIDELYEQYKAILFESGPVNILREDIEGFYLFEEDLLNVSWALHTDDITSPYFTVVPILRNNHYLLLLNYQGPLEPPYHLETILYYGSNWEELKHSKEIFPGFLSFMIGDNLQMEWYSYHLYRAE